MSVSKKISVSLPVDSINDLDMLSRHLGVSRSALLSGLLGVSLPRLSVRIAVSDSIAELDAETDAEIGLAPKRYTSSSKENLDRYLGNLFNGDQYDLFDR